MDYFVIVLSGFLVGKIIAVILEKKTKWIDCKAETELYMKNKYGSDWTKLNQ